MVDAFTGVAVVVAVVVVVAMVAAYCRRGAAADLMHAQQRRRPNVVHVGVRRADPGGAGLAGLSGGGGGVHHSERPRLLRRVRVAAGGPRACKVARRVAVLVLVPEEKIRREKRRRGEHCARRDPCKHFEALEGRGVETEEVDDKGEARGERPVHRADGVAHLLVHRPLLEVHVPNVKAIPVRWSGASGGQGAVASWRGTTEGLLGWGDWVKWVCVGVRGGEREMWSSKRVCG